MAGSWRLRLHDLVGDDPARLEALRALLADHLRPVLPAAEQDRVGAVVMRAEARDRARAYMAGRDQHIAES